MASTRLGWLLLGAGACCLALASCAVQEEADQPEGPEEEESTMSVEETAYGTLPDGREVHLYTLENSNGMRVKLTDYGAITVSVEVPDKDGKVSDVTLGYDTLEGWLGNTSYFGATVGRYANRIAQGKFELEGQTYTLATNNGENHLHGGIKGFDKVLWKGEMTETDDGVGVRFTRTSPDGEEGYPGNLQVTALYTLTGSDEFKAEFSATADKPTVVNLAHHTYWNLRGPENGDILGHVLMLNADQYTPVDEGLIPTGELKAVEGTPMDFTQPKPVGRDIAGVEGGYDHNFVLNGYQPGKVRLAARVTEPTTGRIMEIHTDQPGIQFYSGNFLDGSVTGKKGVKYEKHFGFCLETQHYPDSPNKPDFPSVVLKTGQTYKHVMIHKFSTE
jgi:aldose 1-epimerase